MRIIHCTKRLLKEIEAVPIEFDRNVSALEGMGNWYANLIRIDRRKCIIFTNEKTLYTFLIPKVVKNNLKNIEHEFLTHLTFNLQSEGFGIEIIHRIQQEYREIRYAKTANRSVLGSMNDLASLYEHRIMGSGGIDNMKILAINQETNRTPMGALKYVFPIKALKNLLQ